MSYRDLRNFTEMMRALGYPRLISMENFRNPNFPLVAEIMVWLVERIDPSANISLEITEEADRVHLIRTTAQVLALKAGLKLNTKKLYQADGYAVKELIKVAQLFYNSLKMEKSSAAEDTMSVVDTVLKVQAASSGRQQVADITRTGATLYDLLGHEPQLRDIRNSRAARHLEITQVEAAIREATNSVSKEISKTKELIGNVAANEASLDSKIEKKKSDLERYTKRLQSLKKMRPAFMDEFEKVEEELKVLYEEYVIKSRNLSYLESVLEQVSQAESVRQQMKQASARRILENIKSADVTREVIDGGASNEMTDNKNNNKSIQNRVSAAKGSRKNFGSMGGGIEDSDDDDDDDSDLLLDGDLTEDEDPRSLKDLSEDDF